jgi:hypothetical protein
MELYAGSDYMARNGSHYLQSNPLSPEISVKGWYFDMTCVTMYVKSIERRNIMLPILHPMSKTSIELRRAINRLLVFIEQNPSDDHVTSGAVQELIDDLKAARSHIPHSLRDPDIEENK